VQDCGGVPDGDRSAAPRLPAQLSAHAQRVAGAALSLARRTRIEQVQDDLVIIGALLVEVDDDLVGGTAILSPKFRYQN
jgi:hypothetical protein